MIEKKTTKKKGEVTLMGSSVSNWIFLKISKELTFLTNF